MSRRPTLQESEDAMIRGAGKWTPQGLSAYTKASADWMHANESRPFGVPAPPVQRVGPEPEDGCGPEDDDGEPNRIQDPRYWEALADARMVLCRETDGWPS